MKKCTKCGIEKSLDDYYSNSRGGYRPRCKECLKQDRNKRDKERYHTDPVYKLQLLCRRRAKLAMKHNSKNKSTIELLGCTGPELKEHLEQQFQEGMSWDNHGDWHIDHIKPCAAFDLSDPKQQEACFHYTNLQPLWAQHNLQKRDKY